MAEIKVIKYASNEYDLEVSLRDEVLRKPLGLNFSVAELAEEVNSFHLGFFENKELLGCLVLKPVNNEILQMRQVAVSPNSQGSGIGKCLVEFSEDFAIDHGYKTMMLHARESAVNFYERMNYVKVGEPFLEVSLTHWMMEKSLG